MATIENIDTQSAVRKYLERRVVINREDGAEDPSDEIASVLESVALAFLLSPQASLTFVLRAKNALQQIVTADIEMLDYLLAALDDVQNPNEPITDTSDLIEAQTALVEVDRLGRISSDVRAYDRYTAAVNRFLDLQLAKTVKRRRRGEFERTGPEARQDLFRVLSAYLPSHTVMAARLATLSTSVSNFTSVDLTRLVATRTITRVRSSLKKIISGLNRGEISKTSAAIELLTGSASLGSLSNGRTIYDPLIETNAYPVGRKIRISSEVVASEAVGTTLTVDLNSFSAPWEFYSSAAPYLGVTTALPETTYLLAKRIDDSLPFIIPVTGRTLYVELEGVAPPVNEAVTVVAIPLTAGSQTAAFVAAEIHAALSPEVSCTVIGGRIHLLGGVGPTRLTIRSLVPGTFDGLGNYLPADPSVHEVLGFTADRPSELAGFFTPEMLVSYLSSFLVGCGIFLEDGGPVVRSDLAGPTSNLQFGGPVAAAFGFEGLHVSEPSYLTFQESGVTVSPASLGLVVGSLVIVADQDTTRSLRSPILRILDNQVYFDVTGLPRVSNAEVLVLSPLVDAVQTLLASLRPYIGTFEKDAQELQRALVPILSQPALAQISDARNVLTTLRARVAGLGTSLSNVVVREDQNEHSAVVRSIVNSLEERGLDRALELLLQGEFSKFFSLTRETASKSSHFMKTAEDFVRAHIPAHTTDENTPDLQPLGVTDDLLFGDELSSGDE